jgi:hypothetical protein
VTRRPDLIRDGIAKAIQHHFITDPAQRPKLLPTPDNVISIEGTAVSPTETVVRVKTTDRGILYFTIKLTANI